MRYMIMLLAVLVISSVGFGQTTWYVPDDFPAGIQAAISDPSVLNGDTIVVREGTYYENIDFLGKAITVTSEFGAPLTVIEGDRTGPVVKFVSGEGPDSVLSGLTITNGKYGYGGGIHCESTSPTITGNRVDGNNASYGGGIACMFGAAPQITGNKISFNDGHYQGGGIFCWSSSPYIAHNIIHRNRTEYKKSHGGARGGDGGGIYCLENSDPVIFNNLIIDNLAGSGGGIQCRDSNPSISSNTIARNRADYGCGVLLSGCDLEIKNNIFMHDYNNNYPEIWLLLNSTLTIEYSAVHGGQAEVFIEAGSTLNWGPGMIDSDPLFVDPEDNDHRLQQEPCQPGTMSPCVDAGDPASQLFDGSTRSDGVQDTGVLDMGFHYALIPAGVDIYVPDDCATIQEAIYQASEGDTVIVRPGTYHERIQFIGRNITLKSELGPDRTILDGDRSGSVVTFRHGETYFTRLEGFTIMNGSGSQPEYTNYYGGGIYCWESGPVITCNIIRDNDIVHSDYASSGGGISCMYSNAIIKNNLIENNASEGAGGIGVWVDSSVITGNTIRANHAESSGGVSLGGGGSDTLFSYNCIEYNTATRRKAGVSVGDYTATSPTIEFNIIRYNTVTGRSGYGGGIFCSSHSTSVISSNLISHNYAPEYGGGVGIHDSQTHLVNNLVAHNESAHGGGIHILGFDDESVILEGNTVVFNTATSKGGGLHCKSGAVCETGNTIFWGNTAPVGAQICLDDGYASSMTILYSDVEGGQSQVHVEPGCTLNWGGGMIDADPLFASGPLGDFYLSQVASGQAADSPCVDSGDPSITDIEGTTRTDEAADDWPIDMGFHYFRSPVLDIKCNGEDSGVVVVGGDNAQVTIGIQNDFPLAVDIWVVARDSNGNRFSSRCGRWWSGWCREYYTGVLYSFTDTVFDDPLPVGNYRAWLVIDTNPNGNLNIPEVFDHDMVDFQVVP